MEALKKVIDIKFIDVILDDGRRSNDVYETWLIFKDGKEEFMGHNLSSDDVKLRFPEYDYSELTI
jgi:hypothetical protein